MTEADWLTATDPRPMLEFLRGQASDRKLRLFAVACCRRIWEWVTHEDCHRAVLVAEQLADGEATLQKCNAAGDAVSVITNTAEEFFAVASSCAVGWATSTGPEEWDATTWTLLSAMQNAAYHAALACEHPSPEKAEQAALLRDIFGHPLRPVAFDPAWRSETVSALAAGIYADRAFDRLPILADALEEAGCDQPDILNHCRGPGPHVRGCWAVDLVLGKS